jgi:hypothetical protein
MIELLEFIFRSGWTFAGFSFLFILFTSLIETIFTGISDTILSTRTKYTKDKNNMTNTNETQN